jgi:hypothetical protein
MKHERKINAEWLNEFTEIVVPAVYLERHPVADEKWQHGLPYAACFPEALCSSDKKNKALAVKEQKCGGVGNDAQCDFENEPQKHRLAQRQGPL